MGDIYYEWITGKKEERMNKEEAKAYGEKWINDIDSLCDNDKRNLDDEDEEMYEFLKEAVSALQQEPSGDAISRQAAIDYLMDNMTWYSEDGYETDEDEKRDSIESLINAVPSVTPQQNVENPCIDCGMNYCVDEVCKKKNEFLQQKVGRWIYKKELRDESLPYGQQVKYECSICEFHSRTNVFNYCPNCGAKMEVEE